MAGYAEAAALERIVVTCIINARLVALIARSACGSARISGADAVQKYQADAAAFMRRAACAPRRNGARVWLPTLRKRAAVRRWKLR